MQAVMVVVQMVTPGPEGQTLAAAVVAEGVIALVALVVQV
jgi:hypothetical protein